MKRITLLLIVALGWMTYINAQDIHPDSIAVAHQDTVAVIDEELSTEEFIIDALTEISTLIKAEKEKTPQQAAKSNPYMVENLLNMLIVVVLPLAIIFLVLSFRYKNRKAKYALIEKAIESGREIPESLFTGEKILKEEELLRKGIRNTAIGLGLFIFLWSLTTEFGIGAIGLLVMLTGIGQIAIYYLTDTKSKPYGKEKKENNVYNIDQHSSDKDQNTAE